MAQIRVWPIGVGLLAVVCVQGCGTHARPAIRPAHRAQTLTARIETQDTALANALLALAMIPSAEHHRAVADEYHRLRILDTAFDHLTAAVAIDQGDAAAYDARARIWRDWGFPDLGMGDAARAIYYAPRSPAAYNTRGTLFAALGWHEEARREFEAALALDSTATYARENLRYLNALNPAALATTPPPFSRERRTPGPPR
jgi:tetratricopeptide (TPR) repeat protein